MKIFFGWTQLAAVAYYRFISYAKYMRKIKGVEVAHSKFDNYDSNIFNWQQNLTDRGVLKQVEMLTKTADVSVFGVFDNAMAIAYIQAMKEMYKKPLLMEIDDYAFNLPGYNVASHARTPGSNYDWITEKQLSLSDGIITSTNTLKELYSKYNKNIHIVPNGVDLEVWRNVKQEKKTSENIRIGFSGSPNHVGDIRMIKDVINKILDKYPNVEFHFMGCYPEFFGYDKRIIIVDRFCPVETFPQELADAQFDIGIAPLKDNLFNRAKSNLRWLELSMLKVPCVASNMNAYRESIKNEKTGYLCSTADEWVDCLSALIENETLRKKIGNYAYSDVVANYNIKDIAKDYLEILKEFK